MGTTLILASVEVQLVAIYIRVYFPYPLIYYRPIRRCRWVTLTQRQLPGRWV